MTFAITKAQRKATPALIAIWGGSGSGKTMSALLMARGLVGPSGKIGLIDTENRRAEFYADIAGGWNHLDLQPPFSPDRYSEAFQEFEDAGGFGCIVVDTMSHVWQGEGGILEMADEIGGNGLHKWKAPKMAFQRMQNKLLRAKFHVIFCLRAKEGVRQKGSGKGAEIESIGLTPICEKGFIHEMTVSVLLGPDHKPLFQETERLKCSPLVPMVKAPDELWGSIKPNHFLNEETGAAITEWIGGGAAFDQEFEQMKRVARDVSTLGMDALEKHWTSLSKAQRKRMAGILDDLKATAARADSEPAGEAGATEPNDDAPFGDRFTPAGTNGATPPAVATA